MCIPIHHLDKVITSLMGCLSVRHKVLHYQGSAVIFASLVNFTKYDKYNIVLLIFRVPGPDSTCFKQHDGIHCSTNDITENNAGTYSILTK